MNRCVIFETSERSFHGVEEVRCPPGMVRQSFAVYYYDGGAAQDYRGVDTPPSSRARPDESLKRLVLMPAEKALKQVKAQGDRARRVKERLSRLVSR
ncbi:MAG: 2OG-Fe(II) oxygenase [Sandaracinaceae bacterium]|nr:2OG-Fe(II) oxygenase [Sandaracinaceae bacterium]